MKGPSKFKNISYSPASGPAPGLGPMQSSALEAGDIENSSGEPESNATLNNHPTGHSGTTSREIVDEADISNNSTCATADLPKKQATNGNGIVEIDLDVPPEAITVEPEEQSGCSKAVAVIEVKAGHFFHRHRRAFFLGIKLLLLAIYIAFFIKCVVFRVGDKGSMELLGITAFIVLKIVLDQLRKTQFFPKLVKTALRRGSSHEGIRARRRFRIFLYVVALTGLCVYLALEVMRDSVRNVQALAGIASLIFGSYIFSKKPSKVNWHPVFWGFLLQFFFGVITLRTRPGYALFKWMGDLVTEFVRISDAGSNFVLGASFRATNPGFFFETAGMIVFFNACIFVLDYFGVLEAVILTLGRALAFCLETGPIESVVAAANIFIGLSEAPLLVRPYLPVITKSELHAIMTTGFSSISGAFMAMFVSAGAPPTHLLTACLISAPAALAISKLIYPEQDKVDFSKQQDIRMRDSSSPKTVMQAIADGATFSIQLIATIMVNMMAFVSILALVDNLIIWCGQRAGWPHLTFNYISSYVFYPLSWVMGIPSYDCKRASYLLGLKLLATPFVAYKDLGALIQNRVDFENYVTHSNSTWHYSGNDIILDAMNTTLKDGILEPRSEAILTYAMCGLSAFPAIGFSMGTLIPMSPIRKPDVIKLVLRAFVAGNLANFATGAVAGVLFDG